MNQLRLDKRTRDVLDRIRHGSRTLSVYEMPPTWPRRRMGNYTDSYHRPVPGVW